MQLYHFKGGDGFNFEAFIFAESDQRAGELFTVQLMMSGEDPDAMIWRAIEADWFGEPHRSSLQKALELGVEGIALKGENGWCPVPPHDSRTHD